MYVICVCRGTSIEFKVTIYDFDELLMENYNKISLGRVQIMQFFFWNLYIE